MYKILKKDGLAKRARLETVHGVIDSLSLLMRSAHREDAIRMEKDA